MISSCRFELSQFGAKIMMSAGRLVDVITSRTVNWDIVASPSPWTRQGCIDFLSSTSASLSRCIDSILLFSLWSSAIFLMLLVKECGTNIANNCAACDSILLQQQTWPWQRYIWRADAFLIDTAVEELADEKPSDSSVSVPSCKQAKWKLLSEPLLIFPRVRGDHKEEATASGHNDRAQKDDWPYYITSFMQRLCSGFLFLLPFPLAPSRQPPARPPSVARASLPAAAVSLFLTSQSMYWLHKQYLLNRTTF